MAISSARVAGAPSPGRMDLSGVATGMQNYVARREQLPAMYADRFGMPGLAYLATTGDEEAQKFFNRRGIDYQQYAPSAIYDDEGNITGFTPPEGVPWNEDQRAVFGTEMLGFEFPDVEEPGETPALDKAEKGVITRERRPIQPEQAERPDMTEVGEEPEEPAVEEVTQRRPTETAELTEGDTTRPRREREPRGASRTIDRYPEYLDVFRGGADSLGRRGSFAEEPAEANEAVRYLIRERIEDLAGEQNIDLSKQGQLEAVVQGAIDTANQNPNFPGEVTLSPGELRTYAGDLFVENFDPDAKPTDRSADPRNRTDRMPEAVNPPSTMGDGPVRMPEGYRTEDPVDIRAFGGPESAAPRRSAPRVSRAPQISAPIATLAQGGVATDVQSMPLDDPRTTGPEAAAAGLSQATGASPQQSTLMLQNLWQNVLQSAERGRQQGRDAASGNKQAARDRVEARVELLDMQDVGDGMRADVFRVNDTEIPIRTREARQTAKHVGALIEKPDSERARGAKAAITDALRRSAQDIRPLVAARERSGQRMVPVDNFAAAVDAFIRSDPAGASQYFTEQVNNYLSAASTRASTEYNEAMAREAGARARAREVETEAVERLGPEAQERLLQQQIRRNEIELSMMEQQLAINPQMLVADLEQKFSQIGLTDTQAQLTASQIGLDWASLELQAQLSALSAQGEMDEAVGLAVNEQMKLILQTLDEQGGQIPQEAQDDMRNILTSTLGGFSMEFQRRTGLGTMIGGTFGNLLGTREGVGSWYRDYRSVPAGQSAEPSGETEDVKGDFSTGYDVGR